MASSLENADGVAEDEDRENRRDHGLQEEQVTGRE